MQTTEDTLYYRRTFGSDVRVEVGPDLVILVAANGAYLPEDLGPALDYAKTLAVRALYPVYDGFFRDDVTGDPEALVLMYERHRTPRPLPITEETDE